MTTELHGSPKKHGYKLCERCGVWRRPADGGEDDTLKTTEVDGVKRVECADRLLCNRLKRVMEETKP